jgi:hypothetical protein
LWAAPDPRLHLGDDLLQQQGALGLVVALGRGQPGGQLLLDDPGDDPPHGGVPSTSLVCPSNCGSASRTVTTAVSPARMSSFSTLSAPTLRRRALSSSWLAEHLEQGLLEAGHVGAALGVCDDVDERLERGCRSRSPTARDVDVALPLHLGGRHVALRVEHRHRLGEVPDALQPPHRR